MNDVKQPKAYIAGPMRGYPEFNFPAFFEAQERLEECGWLTVSPAERDTKGGFETAGLTGHEDLSELGFDLRDALAWDLDQIARECDAVVVLPGWEDSKGANAEVATAKALGLRVATLDEATLANVKPGDGTTLRVWWDHAFYLTNGRPASYYGAIARPKGYEASVGDGAAEFHRGCLYLNRHAIAIACVEAAVEDEEPVEMPRLKDLLRAPDVFADGEERVVSATGGEKGRKVEELASLDPKALRTLAKVSGFGARKYDAFNYLKGYDWTLSLNALLRHVMAFAEGEDLDPESGLPHTAHAAWHGLALTSFVERGLGTDDRFKQG